MQWLSCWEPKQVHAQHNEVNSHIKGKVKSGDWKRITAVAHVVWPVRVRPLAGTCGNVWLWRGLCRMHPSRLRLLTARTLFWHLLWNLVTRTAWSIFQHASSIASCHAALSIVPLFRPSANLPDSNSSRSFKQWIVIVASCGVLGSVVAVWSNTDAASITRSASNASLPASNLSASAQAVLGLSTTSATVKEMLNKSPARSNAL